MLFEHIHRNKIAFCIGLVKLLHCGSQANLPEVQKVFQYLRNRGIRCRLKTRIQGFNRAQNAELTTAVVEVHKEDERRARELMNGYNK